MLIWIFLFIEWWNCDQFFFLCLTLQFDTDYVEFCSQFDNLRQQMQNFVDSWFDKDLTVSSNWKKKKDSYRKTSGISRALVGNKIVDNSDVVGASTVGAAPTTSSFST